jgi:hypothetical protein
MISRNIHTKPICTISDMYKGLIAELAYDRVRGRLLFNANSAIFQLYHGENKSYYKVNRPSWSFIMLAHWNNNPSLNMSLYSDILSRFRDDRFLILLLNAACLAESSKFQFHSLWFEPTMYITWSENAIHYIIDAVKTYIW